jgi:hypothetical protein
VSDIFVPVIDDPLSAVIALTFIPSSLRLREVGGALHLVSNGGIFFQLLEYGARVAISWPDLFSTVSSCEQESEVHDQRVLDDVGSKTCAAFVEALLDTLLVANFQQLDDGENFETVPKSSFGNVADALDIQGCDGPLAIPRDLHRSRPQSSSASRFTAGAPPGS